MMLSWVVQDDPRCNRGSSSPQLLMLCKTIAGRLKQQCTVLAVSHDLRELVPLVDQAWRMEAGGILKPSSWPPTRAIDR